MTEYFLTNPWHCLPLNPQMPEVVTALIEIPKGSRAKYEIDKETGFLKLDRILLPSMSYPANYGFIPRTYAGDSDPLDVLVLSQVSLEARCIVEARVIGVLRMIDSDEVDDKIIAVATGDVTVNHMHDINDVPEYLLNEIFHFFEQYKMLENKIIKLEDFRDKAAALEIVNESVENYQDTFSSKVAMD